MGTILLKEALGTKYVINALSGALRSILTQAQVNGDVVDLADCKLGPDCAVLLNSYYQTLDMVNSTDSRLDALLKSNIQRSRFEPEEYAQLEMRGVRSINVFMELVKTIPSGAKVKPIVSLSQLLDKVTLVLLIMSRPDVEFDIRGCASDIFDYVRDAWISTAEPHNAYYELIAPDVVLRYPDEDGYFGSQEYGFQRESSFIRNRTVLPYEFGNEKIVSMDGTGVKPEWQLVVEKCLDAFDTSYTEKAPGKVLRNLLTFRGEE